MQITTSVLNTFLLYCNIFFGILFRKNSPLSRLRASSSINLYIGDLSCRELLDSSLRTFYILSSCTSYSVVNLQNNLWLITVIIKLFFIKFPLTLPLPGHALSDSITHYEPLSYPRQHVNTGHNRVRRSSNPEEKLYLHFRALGR